MVTAQKRLQTVQDVPSSVAAISEEMLEKTNSFVPAIRPAVMGYADSDPHAKKRTPLEVRFFFAVTPGSTIRLHSLNFAHLIII